MFIPKTIDLGQSEKYILSIRIKPSQFMFSISEPNIGKNYCLRQTELPLDVSLLDNVKRIIFDFNFLTQEFLQTNVVFESTEYDLIPMAYLDERHKDTLYNLSHSNTDKHVAICRNKKQKLATLFGIDRDLHDFLARSLSNPTFYHHSHLLGKFFEDKNKMRSITSKMYINIADDMMDIVVFDQWKLIHCLSYRNESPSNQLYYILNLWEKCGLDQQSDQLLIHGKPNKKMLSSLQEYISNIDSIHLPSEIHLWNEDALQAPIDLLTLSL